MMFVVFGLMLAFKKSDDSKFIIMLVVIQIVVFIKSPASWFNQLHRTESLLLHASCRDALLSISFWLVFYQRRFDSPVLIRSLCVIQCIMLALFQAELIPISGFSNLNSIDASFLAIASFSFNGPLFILLNIPTLLCPALTPKLALLVMCIYHFNKHRLFLFGVGLFAASLLIYFDEQKDGGRIDMIIGTLKVLYEAGPLHWVFGMGFGSFKLFGPIIAGGEEWIVLNNEYVQLLFEAGLVGVLSVFCFIYWRLYNFTHQWFYKSLLHRNALTVTTQLVGVFFVSGLQATFHCGTFVLLVTLILAQQPLKKDYIY